MRKGIRSVPRYGLPSEVMPKDLPPSRICYDDGRRLSESGHRDRINPPLVRAEREKAGRQASPTLAIIDAQSVTGEAPQGERGGDASKKVVGGKRPTAVDIDGRLLAVAITKSDVQDQDGSLPLVKRLVRLCPWIKMVVVDGGYQNRFIDMVETPLNRVVEVVKRPAFAQGFVLLPKRWTVEQSIGAPTRSRRLKVEDDTLIHVSVSAILFAVITRLLASVTRQ